MAVTQRRKTTVVNSARGGGRRKYTAKQIAAGFGGARRKAAMKAHKKASRASKANRPSHRPRSKPKVSHRPNLGKIISFSLPKESTTVAGTKKNTGRKSSSHRSSRRNTKANTGRPRHRRRNAPSMGDLTGLVTSAVFTIAGAVGTKYITQMVLTTSNTGVMGYFGNLVSAFLLSWGVKAFMKNDRAAAAVLSGGIVQVVLRLIADYTPFGQYTANLGMGDYLAQNFTVPQRIAFQTHSAQLMPPTTNGLGSCCGLYSGSGLYANAA